jgi:predicted alpha/beta-hydrolase family hydrolase
MDAISAASPSADSGVEPMRARVLLAHGAGSSSTHPHLLRLAAHLEKVGNSVTAFDFPYRVNGRQLPDKMPVLLTAMWQMVQTTSPLNQPCSRLSPLFLAGHSMGGRVALRVAAGEGSPPSDTPLPKPAGVLLFSYPLRAATGKGALRLDGFAECESKGIPMLLISGDRDSMAPPDLRQTYLAGFSKLTQITLPGLDHGWAPKSNGPDTATIDALVVQSIHQWQVKALALNP